jgi:hypothetical protein
MIQGPEEVRRRVATSSRRIWSAPCGPDLDLSGGCRHTAAFAVIEASVRNCVASQGRPVAPITGNHIAGLDSVASSDLIISKLTAPIVATSSCAVSDCCIADRAAVLRDALFRAHARGAVDWIAEHYQLDQNLEVQQSIAECLIETASNDNHTILLEYAATLLGHPRAIRQFLNEVARIATYDVATRRLVAQIWPALMDSLFDKIDIRGSNCINVASSARKIH